MKKENAASISNQVAPKFQWMFNYECHYNGRIWLGWDPSAWTISGVKVHSQHISCKATSLRAQLHFFVSFVYASTNYIERRDLWNDLFLVNSNLPDTNSPWALSGDFNVCLKLEEASNAPNVISIEMRDFIEAVEELDVFDLSYSGKLFTWSDCNHYAPIFKKLDRVLVNSGWTDVFSLSRAQFFPRGLSDHNPAVTFLGVDIPKLFKPFQVYQHIIQHADFLPAVANAWNSPVRGDPWFILSSKLKRVKHALKQLNLSNGNLHEAVNAARNALLLFQDNLSINPSADAIQIEERLCSELQKALSAEEVFLRQKSRVQWLDLGDGNNSFFHRSCKNRWNSNKLLILEDRNGDTHTEHGKIADIATSYFRDLLGSDHPAEQFDFNIDLPKLSNS